MNNYKFVIESFYEKHNLDENARPDILDLYLTKNANNDTELKKVQIILSIFHNELNYYFDYLNTRIKGKRYFPAHQSRELIYLINDIFEFSSALKGSFYSFRTTKQCYALLKKAQSFLRESGGSDIPDDVEPLILPKYTPIFEADFLKNNLKGSDPSNDLVEIITKVSTNSTEYSKMSNDEKLEKLNMAIEYLLKTNGKYVHLDYKELFGVFISEQSIVSYRNITNCFRHGSKDAIESRNLISERYKRFLIEYGVLICHQILSYLKQTQ